MVTESRQGALKPTPAASHRRGTIGAKTLHQLTITTGWRRETVHLCVTGDVDLATSRALDQAITTCVPTGGVLVDLAAVTFLDCTGVAALFTGRRNAATRDVSYQAVSAGRIALRGLQILDLDLDIALSHRDPH